MLFSQDGDLYIKDMASGTKAVYKYFDLEESKTLAITARGKGEIQILIQSERGEIRSGKSESDKMQFVSEKITIKSTDWSEYHAKISGGSHSQLTLLCCAGKVDLRDFVLS